MTIKEDLVLQNEYFLDNLLILNILINSAVCGILFL